MFIGCLVTVLTQLSLNFLLFLKIYFKPCHLPLTLSYCVNTGSSLNNPHPPGMRTSTLLPSKSNWTLQKPHPRLFRTLLGIHLPYDDTHLDDPRRHSSYHLCKFVHIRCQNHLNVTTTYLLMRWVTRQLPIQCNHHNQSPKVNTS